MLTKPKPVKLGTGFLLIRSKGRLAGLHLVGEGLDSRSLIRLCEGESEVLGVGDLLFIPRAGEEDWHTHFPPLPDPPKGKRGKRDPQRRG